MGTEDKTCENMANSDMQSKTLIANWVEEVYTPDFFLCREYLSREFVSHQRQCAGLDQENRRTDGTLSTSLHRSGHQGILAAAGSQQLETASTIHDSYGSPQQCSVRTTGSGVQPTFPFTFGRVCR